MQWTVQQVDAVVRGGLWSKTAIFITWDDWGGWFDHVDPPNVEAWKDDGSHPAWNGTQFRYGTRVGCLVLSPYAKVGHISSVLHSHVSLLKFCETTFGLAPLNARDRAARRHVGLFRLLAAAGAAACITTAHRPLGATSLASLWSSPSRRRRSSTSPRTFPSWRCC